MLSKACRNPYNAAAYSEIVNTLEHAREVALAVAAAVLAVALVCWFPAGAGFSLAAAAAVAWSIWLEKHPVT